MRVLIVDDSRAMRLIIRRYLRRSRGHTFVTTEAEDAMEAWKKLRAQTYDLILCDWNMPKMTGLDLLRRLRKAGITTPFGFITVECCQESMDAARTHGAAFVLQKPTSEAALERAIAALKIA